ncbi:MAG: DUF3102 domain-containing protein [Clostridiales Family XIII bacterium]|nr:DUF3102 domain-containing protein [Clostridiales Family XIII bacterium]
MAKQKKESKVMPEKVSQEVVEVADVRTPEIIAAEIKATVRTVRELALGGAIRIGQCLAEAKELVGHGSWLEYLSESVGFSERSAQNYMRIFKEYGTQVANPQLVADLSYTNALRLLTLPDEDQKEIVSGLESGEVSPEDVAQEIETYKARAQQLEDEKKRLEDENVELQAAYSGVSEKLDNVQKDIDRYKTEAQAVKADAKFKIQEEVDTQVAAAKKELEEKASSASQAELEELKKTLADAEARAAKAEKDKALAASEEKVLFKATCDDFQGKFHAAKAIADKVGTADPEMKGKMVGVLKTVLETLGKALEG